MSTRQEVHNVMLAMLLRDRGLVAVPEQIVRAVGDPRRKMPDVLVDLLGLRLAIEGDFASTPSVKESAAGQARSRVENGIAHIGMAVIYPDALRTVPFEGLSAAIARATLEFAVVTESPDEPAFTKGNVDGLCDSLRRAYEQLVEDKVLDRAVSILEAGIDRFVAAALGQTAAPSRFAAILDVRAAGPETQGEDELL